MRRRDILAEVQLGPSQHHMPGWYEPRTFCLGLVFDHDRQVQSLSIFWRNPDGWEENVRGNFDPCDFEELMAQARAAGWPM
jgi:hypothetical protein